MGRYARESGEKGRREHPASTAVGEVKKERDTDRAATKKAVQETMARVELKQICHEFRPNQTLTPAQMRDLWVRLKSAKRRARGVGLPHQSYDVMGEMGMVRI